MRLAWLPASLPASARRFRVGEPALRAVLEDAGAVFVEEHPDVEIAEVLGMRGDAECALVSFDLERPQSWPRAARAGWTAVSSLRLRLDTVRATRTLRRLGYRAIDVKLWDWLQGWRAPETDRFGREAIARRLPLNALVRGWRSRPEPTILHELIAEAEIVLGHPFDPGEPLFRRGLVVSIGEGGVLRAAVGPARRRIDEQRRALAELEAASEDPVIRRRAPWPLGGGRHGLADWSLERRLPGVVASLDLSDELLEDCLDFLVALHAAGRKAPPSYSFADDAEIVAASCRPAVASDIRRVGGVLERRLGDVPPGFGHGDFWAGNLLVDQGRLVGVVDWDFGGPGRLPLVDLLSLRLGTVRIGRRLTFGQALADDLLPWARAGGDEPTRSYCERIGLSVDPGRLQDFVAALWLETLARDLRTYPDLGEQTAWTRENVESVVSVVAERSAD